MALALASGSGTELPASDRIARGHSERLNGRLKTVEQVAARWKMFCMNQSAVVVKTRFTLNDVTAAMQTTSSPFYFLAGSHLHWQIKHPLTCAWPLAMHKSNPVTTQMQPTKEHFARRFVGINI